MANAVLIVWFAWLSFFKPLQCITFSAPQLYILRGNLKIASSQVNENYEVWYNGLTQKSRIDFYDGMDQLFREYDSKSRKFIYHKIFPMYGKNSNSLSCNVMTATPELVSVDQNYYLPIKNYSFVGHEELPGIKTQKWEYKRIIYAPANVQEIYTIWVKDISSSTIVPVRYTYEVKNDHKVLDSYEHDYTYFEAVRPDDSILQVPLGVTCETVELSPHEPIDPLMEYVNPSIERSRVKKAFEIYKSQFNKKYSTEDEHHERMMVFLNNLRYINSVNRQHKSYTLGINHFADKTDDELSAFVSLNIADDITKGNNTIEDDDEEDIFDAFSKNIDVELDWRKFGAITEVKDQTSLCGSCYAFVTAAAIESAAYVHRGCKNLEEASEQAVIDCSWPQKNHGCNGGWLAYALDWVKDNGLPLKKEYGPYLVTEGVCHVSEMKKFLKISSYEKLPSKKKSIKKAIQKKGPLLVAVDSRPKSFLFYSSGVYNDRACQSDPSKVTHGVTLIGYGRLDEDNQYWILKNSYGKSWGEKGFVRIAIEKNICGVKNYAYSVTFNKLSDVYKCFTESFDESNDIHFNYKM